MSADPDEPAYCSTCEMYVPLEREPHVSAKRRDPHYAAYRSKEEAEAYRRHADALADSFSLAEQTKREREAR